MTMRMFAEVVANSIEELVERYGYSLKIQQRSNSFDLFLIYPDYCRNDPLRIMTFSDEFSYQAMLNDSQTVDKILEVIGKNERKRIVKI